VFYVDLEYIIISRVWFCEQALLGGIGVGETTATVVGATFQVEFCCERCEDFKALLVVIDVRYEKTLMI
jgi:hypothetical protein